MYKVKDYTKFKLFDYENQPCPTFQLGDVLYKGGVDGDPNEVGVVLQTFSDGDVRTDMWGMCSPSEVRYSTIEDIKYLRPELLDDIVPKNDMSVEQI